MTGIAALATSFVALLHICFLVLEMFLWNRPAGRKAFRLTHEFASATRVMAANQGLYNGFWPPGCSGGSRSESGAPAIELFFLGCVVIAGVFGAVTSSKKILFVQGLPGAIAFALVLLSSSSRP